MSKSEKDVNSLSVGVANNLLVYVMLKNYEKCPSLPRAQSNVFFKLLPLSSQPFKTQRQAKQKAAIPHIKEAGTSKYLTFFLKTNKQTKKHKKHLFLINHVHHEMSGNLSVVI